MVKKRSGLSVRGKPRAKSEKNIPDSKIDFSDIPEFTDEELAKARPVGRPRLEYPKKLMAIRLSPKLIHDLRQLAKKKRKPYQTLLHELLEDAVKRAA
jgi:predicted DNA binding CopG/RHH family protein